MFFAAVASSAQTLPSLLVPSDAAGLGTASANVAATPTAYQVENNVAGMSFSPSRFSAGVYYGMWQPRDAHCGIELFRSVGAFAGGIAAFRGDIV